jgi:hypothetical protein
MMGIEQVDGTLKYVPYNEFYLWIYDDVKAEQKLKDGIYEYPYPTIYFNDDLESIWTENKFKRYKGNKHIVGFIYGQVSKYFSKEGYRDMQIYVMTTKPNFRRIGVNQFAIRYLRKKFNLDKEQVEFKLPTQQGKLFISSNQYKQGGFIAPNGKVSNLTPEQYKLVRSPEFKAWFGDWENDPETASKIVDENGEPLVCYHATNNEFNVFDEKYIGIANDKGFYGKGFYFTDSLTSVKQYGNIIKSYFLKIINPIITDDSPREFSNSIWIPKGAKNYLGQGLKPTEWREWDFYLDDNFSEKVTKNIIINGRDGLIAENVSEFVAFEPEQIKLADGTNTSFDGNNPDIRFDGGGKIITTDK